MNVPTRLHKNGHNSTCDQYFFHKTCTIGFSTHRAINPYQKLNFYEIPQVVPFLIYSRPQIVSAAAFDFSLAQVVTIYMYLIIRIEATR